MPNKEEQMMRCLMEALESGVAALEAQDDCNCQ